MTDPAPDPFAEAFEEATETGERVEIESLRDEYVQTFANPDGLTMTQDSWISPKFGRDSEGDLVDVDTTLEERADGSVRPRAVAVDLELPSAVSNAMTLAYEDHVLELTPEGDLGEPVLDGDTATYVDVFPDVDLKLTALPEGLRQVYVVKTREAAADPRLDKLTFPVDTENGSLEARAGGGVMFLDPVGDVAFTSAPALMWDSSGDHTGLESVTGPGGEKVANFVAPSPGDEVREMPVELTGSGLTVTPVAELLADPTIEFPVYIDPDTSYDRGEWTMVRSDGVKSWRFGGSEGMGRCPTSYDSACTSSYRKRLFYEFGNKGRLSTHDHIIKAEFAVLSNHSTNCNHPRSVTAYQAGGINANTVWPGPASLGALGSATFAYGNGCNNGVFELATNQMLGATRDLVSGNISRLIVGLRATDEADQFGWKRFSNAAVLRITFFRKPGNITGLAVTTFPQTSCQPDAANPTITDLVQPAFYAVVHTSEPNPDEIIGGAGRLRAHFELQRRNSAGGWDPALEMRSPAAGAAPIGYPNNSTVSYDLNAKGVFLAAGAQYRLRARTESLYNDVTVAGSPLKADAGAWTPNWCHFQVDPDAPAQPKITAVEEPGFVKYREEVNGSILWDGGIGKAGKFAYSGPTLAEDNDPNVVNYAHYLVADGGLLEPVTAGSGGPLTGSRITPTQSGPHTLFVRAIDKLNRQGADRAYHFNVADQRRPAAYWHVTEEGGTTIANARHVVDDAPANENEPVLEPAHTRTLSLSSSSLISDEGFGRRGPEVRKYTMADEQEDQETFVPDRSLHFTGAGQYARSDKTVIDTAKSFSLSTWVYLEDTSADRIVLGQKSVNGPAGIELRYLAQQRRWAATWTTLDPDGPGPAASTQVNLIGDRTTVPKVWTQVALVYETASGSSSGTLSLNINGITVATRTLTGAEKPVSTNGNLFIGAPSAAPTANGFRGYIDEIQVWRRAVTADTLAKSGAYDEEKRNLALVGLWNAQVVDEDGSVPDSSPFKRFSLNGVGQVSRDPDTGDVIFGGGHLAAIDGNVFDETGAFTVSANLMIDPTNMVTDQKARIIGRAAPGSVNESSWALWFKRVGTNSDGPVGEWQFGRYDAPPSGQMKIADSLGNREYVEFGNANQHVQVSFVYDPLEIDQELCVYAASHKLGCADYKNPVQSVASLIAGLSQDGATADVFTGRLSCIRAWVGAADSNFLANNAACAQPVS